MIDRDIQLFAGVTGDRGKASLDTIARQPQQQIAAAIGSNCFGSSRPTPRLIALEPVDCSNR